MALKDLPENLRVLCGYGRSVSDSCRRCGINRQQMNKYLNGHTRPSLPVLRRLCDFFGVDEHELLMDRRAFRDLVRLHPPRLGAAPDLFDQTVDHLASISAESSGLLARHEGYYHSYSHADPQRGLYLCSLTRIYREGERWLSKTVDRHLGKHYLVPSTLKYTGVVLEGFNRIVVVEREQAPGRSIFTSYLYGSDYGAPTYLSGLIMNLRPEGEHGISCVRTVWEPLGPAPNLRQALGKCGLVDPRVTPLPDIVTQFTENGMRIGETVFQPRT